MLRPWKPLLYVHDFIVCSRLVACHAKKGGKDSVFESVKPSSFISPLLNMMSEFQSSLQWFQSKCLQAFKHNMVQGLVQSEFLEHIYLCCISLEAFPKLAVFVKILYRYTSNQHLPSKCGINPEHLSVLPVLLNES